MSRRRFLASLALTAFMVCRPGPAEAQPTYKLSVKPDLKPRAELRLEGQQVHRGELRDDPGFRLQYHFKKDGKSLEVAEARSNPSLPVPAKEVGTYTVVLELFYPNYKGGAAQKGEFRPVSNLLTYRVEAVNPPRVVLVEPPRPVLVVQCGLGKGTRQDERVEQGYGYQLIQGTPFDGWPAAAAKVHAWTDPKQVRFEIKLPANTTGTLRLHFVDGDARDRKQKVLVAGKPLVDVEGFAGTGKSLEVPIAAADSRAGKVEVALQNLNPATTAAISTVEFIPQK